MLFSIFGDGNVLATEYKVCVRDVRRHGKGQNVVSSSYCTVHTVLKRKGVASMAKYSQQIGVSDFQRFLQNVIRQAELLSNVVIFYSGNFRSPSISLLKAFVPLPAEHNTLGSVNRRVP